MLPLLPYGFNYSAYASCRVWSSSPAREAGLQELKFPPRLPLESDQGVSINYHDGTIQW